MAAPNILGISTITAKTAVASLSDTSATTLISNASNSGKVFKINTITVANDDGSASADITVSYNDAAAGGGTNYKLAHTIAVAADSTLVVVDRATSIYLEENKSIVVQASAGNDLDVVCSYEELS